MRHSSKALQSASVDFGQSVAVSALTFLAGDADRLQRFLNTTGLGPHNLREAAKDPAFYGSVLDYVAGDEPLLVAFAAEAGIEPQEIVRARDALSGSTHQGGP